MSCSRIFVVGSSFLRTKGSFLRRYGTGGREAAAALGLQNIWSFQDNLSFHPGIERGHSFEDI